MGATCGAEAAQEPDKSGDASPHVYAKHVVAAEAASPPLPGSCGGTVHPTVGNSGEGHVRVDADLQPEDISRAQVRHVARLPELSQELTARLPAANVEVTVPLRADGDAVDGELASGGLDRLLAEAQRTLQDIGTAHREMVAHKASALIDHGRSIAVAEQQQRFREEQGVQQLLL